MPVVQPTGDLTNEDLDRAETFVAAALGAQVLYARPVLLPFQAAGDRVYPLEEGPVTGVGFITVNGVDVAGGFAPWFLRFPDRVKGDVVASYTAGWTTANLPAPIYHAVLLTARTIRDRAPGIKAEAIGPHSRTYTDPTPSGLPPEVEALLLPWMRTRL